MNFNPKQKNIKKIIKKKIFNLEVPMKKCYKN